MEACRRPPIIWEGYSAIRRCKMTAKDLFVPRALSLGGVLGELFGREFAVLDVACVYLREVLPLVGQVIQRENRGDRADRHAGATVYALDGIDVELRDLIERGTAVVIGRVLLGMDAIDGAGIDASGVLHPDAGLGDNVRHRPPPLYLHRRLSRSRIQAKPG